VSTSLTLHLSDPHRVGDRGIASRRSGQNKVAGTLRLSVAPHLYQWEAAQLWYQSNSYGVKIYIITFSLAADKNQIPQAIATIGLRASVTIKC